MKSKHLIQIHIGYLPEGLVLTEDIFNHNGKVLLLPKGERITKEKIDRIKRFGGNDAQIMISSETYLDILRNKDVPEQMRQDLTKDYVGYTQLEETVGDLFRNKNYAVWLGEKTIMPIAEKIFERINEVDPVMILSCVNFPRPMDIDLQRHSLNVAFLNGLLGVWLKCSKRDCELLVKAGLLHDVGKTMIPEEILNAPRKLTDEEFQIVKRHPLYSEQLLKDKFDKDILLTAKQHHEKIDGSGYPDGLKGNDITLFARITAVSDIYDAMVSKRAYKESQLPLYVFDLFASGKLGRVDTDILGIFLKKMRERYTGRSAIMSNNRIGVIEYIPPNDMEHPIVSQGETVAQTDEVWYCKEVLA